MPPKAAAPKKGGKKVPQPLRPGLPLTFPYGTQFRLDSHGEFSFPAGDHYKGGYASLLVEDRLHRHGKGRHVAADGSVFDGFWNNDNITREGSIKFAQGSSYKGSFLDGKYHGKGRYHFPDGSILLAQFNNNQIIGEVSYSDCTGGEWQGKVEGEELVLRRRIKIHRQFTNYRPTKSEYHEKCAYPL